MTAPANRVQAALAAKKAKSDSDLNDIGPFIKAWKAAKEGSADRRHLAELLTEDDFKGIEPELPEYIRTEAAGLNGVTATTTSTTGAGATVNKPGKLVAEMHQHEFYETDTHRVVFDKDGKEVGSYAKTTYPDLSGVVAKYAGTSSTSSTSDSFMPADGTVLYDMNGVKVVLKDGRVYVKSDKAQFTEPEATWNDTAGVGRTNILLHARTGKTKGIGGFKIL